MGFRVEGVGRKACPVLSADSGMNFPLGWPSGNRIPVSEQIPGRSFRLRQHSETTSQSEPIFRDAFSVGRQLGKRVPLCGLRLPLTGWDRGQTPDRHRIYIWLRLCAENPRICFANTHRLRPPAGALARSLQTLRVCLTPAPCTEFDSPRCGGSVDGLRPGLGAGSTSHLFWVEALRGESAYLLRKYAPASAACRRPRPLATNASRLLNARALHRVRFSAVRT